MRGHVVLLHYSRMTNLEHAAQAEALLRQGVTLHEQGQLERALQLYEQARQLRSEDFRAPYLLGVIALAQGSAQRAVVLLGDALRLNPRSAHAHGELGTALRQLGRHEAAIASYDRAITLEPHGAAAHYGRGEALFDLRRYQDALAEFAQAIALAPAAAAFNAHGNALFRLQRYRAALDSYDKAVDLKPGYADAHNNRGNALRQLKQYPLARAAYDRALSLDPGYGGCHHNRGDLLNEMRMYPQALADFDRALELKCAVRELPGLRLSAKMHMCEWRDLDAEVSALSAQIENNEAASNPFTVMALTDSPSLQRKAAELWVREHFPAALAAPPVIVPAHRELRVGYFSADLHNHATSHLMAGLFELHDRSAIRPILFSYGPDSRDYMRSRLKAACQEFIDVCDMSDAEAARAAREREIDIAVDLKGFTQDGRLGIFAERVAPLQLGYLGYPGTTGAPYIDYLIADRTVVPETERGHYSEKIIFMPHSYQVNDAKRPIADKVFARRDLGLPADAFVFCCFNNNYKIRPGTFDCWMRILQRVEGSVLWLFEDNAAAAHNLRREAVRRNVDAERLVFAPRMMPPEHLARHRAADLFLDTLPCNAHTTASDALWAGLPLITCMGQAFAARVAASLLNALELPQLITRTMAEYEDLAVGLAADRARLARIRQALAAKRITAPLFDTRLYTRHLQSALAEVHARRRAGLPPEDLLL